MEPRIVNQLRIISSDSHVVEPENLWHERIDPEFRARGPTLIHEEETDQWYADGVKFGIVVSGTLAGQRFNDPTLLTFKGRYKDGKKEGEYSWYYENGQLNWKMN